MKLKKILFRIIVSLVLLYIGVMLFNLTSYPFVGILVSVAFPCYLSYQFINKLDEENDVKQNP